jgi:hypothetical protein
MSCRTSRRSRVPAQGRFRCARTRVDAPRPTRPRHRINPLARLAPSLPSTRRSAGQGRATPSLRPRPEARHRNRGLQHERPPPIPSFASDQPEALRHGERDGVAVPLANRPADESPLGLGGRPSGPARLRLVAGAALALARGRPVRLRAGALAALAGAVAAVGRRARAGERRSGCRQRERTRKHEASEPPLHLSHLPSARAPRLCRPDGKDGAGTRTPETTAGWEKRGARYVSCSRGPTPESPTCQAKRSLRGRIQEIPDRT